MFQEGGGCDGTRGTRHQLQVGYGQYSEFWIRKPCTTSHRIQRARSSEFYAWTHILVTNYDQKEGMGESSISAHIVTPIFHEVPIWSVKWKK